MASSSSSPSSCLWTYDAFLSFRGEDTRKGFVSHLYDKLVSKGLYTFKDDEKLGKGSSISPTLLKAIKDSKFGIVVISPNYASSCWCLEELTKIVECAEEGSLTVVPIFYEVNPSDVRNQRGSFAKAFRNHEKHMFDSKKVQKWREALTYVGNIAGEDSRKWDNEAQNIQKIVRDIWTRLLAMPLVEMDEFVGMEARLKELALLMCVESTYEGRIIGIWGMGGVGKTTIAKCLYNLYSHRFPTCCFIEVTGKYNTQNLQELLLSEIFHERELRIPRPCFNSIKARLWHSKVLVVIDNVDKLNQLEALANSIDWFGPRSRIVVTTRDKHLLIAHGVKHIYKAKCLVSNEALQLFCQYAFRQKHPKNGFEDLSMQVACHAGGLPLALKVLGSYLCGRSKEEWESALSELRKIPNDDVMRVLKLSYDSLQEQHQLIFLHLACLFSNHDNFNDVKSIMDACGYYTKIVVGVLSDKSLLKINGLDIIEIHDLLRQLACEIVRQQSIDEPGKRKFLMSVSDVHDVLMDNKVAEAIKGISLSELRDDKHFILDDEVLKNVPNLQILILWNWPQSYERKQIRQDLNYLPPKLRLLCWNNYPDQAFPSGFCPKFLVELVMPYSKLEKLWEGIQPIENLRKINLLCSEKLRTLPDFSRAINLEKVILFHCKSIEYFPDIKSRHLKLLDLGNCWSLRRLGKLWSESPMEIDISGSAIEELPLSIINLPCLESLDMTECKRLKNLPTTNAKIKSLNYLAVGGSQRITIFPHVPCNIESLVLKGTKIEEVPSWIEMLSRLKYLDLSSNESLKNIPNGIFRLRSLKELDLSKCLSLENLPPPIPEVPTSLEILNISGTRIKQLPTSLGLLTSLSDLHADNTAIAQHPSFCMKYFQALSLGRHSYKPDGVSFQFPPLSSCMALSSLRLSNLNIPEIPDYIGNLGNLHELDLSGNDFKWIPASVKHLSRLHRLDVNSCQKLQSLPELPVALTFLYARGCISLVEASPGIKHPLRDLYLENCVRLHQDVELLAQRMSSPKWVKKGNPSITILPGYRVPGYFKCKAVGHSIMVKMPRGRTLPECQGFVACLVLPVESGLHDGHLTVKFHCPFNTENGAKDFSSSIPHCLYPCGIVEFECDHLLLFNVDWRDSINGGMVSEEITFDFDLGDLSPNTYVKVKEVGVRLIFNDDTEGYCDYTVTPFGGDYVAAKKDPILVENPVTRNSEEACTSSPLQLGLPIIAEPLTHLDKLTEGDDFPSTKRCHEPQCSEERVADETEEDNSYTRPFKLLKFL